MIKTELAGVRFFHDLTGSKERLPVNSRLDLQKVNFGGVDRSWTNEEVKDALNLANSMGRIDSEMAIKIAYSFGCRIEEVMTLTNAQIKQGIKYKQLDLINTKGKRPRGIDVNPTSKSYNMQLRALQFALEHAKSNDKIFCVKGEQMHKAIKSVQNLIYNNRDKFEHEGRINRNNARRIVRQARDNKTDIEAPRTHITAHGLRHSYAHNLYTEFLQQKAERDRERDIREIEKEARLDVSALLGHGRENVTRIYTPK